MMRVLLLSNMHPSRRWPAYGTFIQAHAEALEREPDVALRRVVITDPRKGWRTPLKYATFAARAWAAGLTNRFDIVHVHYAHPTALGAAVAKRRGAKLVITAHGGDVNEMLMHRAPKFARRAFEAADHIIAVSEDIHAKLKRALGGNCPEISVCNMGVDTERFTPSPHPQSSPARLLFVGQLIDRKGVDVLLHALANLGVAWNLDIIGTGMRRVALKALASDLGLERRVTFHGALPAERLPDLYRGADLFIGPSREEPLGQVFLEAASCGCPVVATRVGGIPEIFADGQSALLVPPDDATSLTTAIERAITDSSLREQLVSGGLSAARRNSQARSIEYTLSVYRRLLGQSS